MIPEDPVTRLCAQGMQAEAAGRPGDAAKHFMAAWEASTTNRERAIAAHYVARHQPDHEGTLHWNSEALRYADASPPDEVQSFYPSLYLNLGHSREVRNEWDLAEVLYGKAVDCIAALDESPYSAVVRGGVESALARVALHRSRVETGHASDQSRSDSS